MRADIVPGGTFPDYELTDHDNWGRPSIEDLRRGLREVTREIRPDWDLGAPGLREEWDSGGRSSFFTDEDLAPLLRVRSS